MNLDTYSKNEAEVISDILNGNRGMYKYFVDRYSPMVFHIVRKFEKDEDEAEELAQQIFVKAYEKLHSFKKDSKFSTWLYSLAHNHCRDYAKNIRRSNKRFSELEEDFIDNIHSNTHSPYKELEQKEWEILLKSALNRMSTEYAEPFLLKYRDGLSYEVMSEQMDVSVSALKVRVHRARKELKYLLKKEV